MKYSVNVIFSLFIKFFKEFMIIEGISYMKSFAKAYLYIKKKNDM